MIKYGDMQFRDEAALVEFQQKQAIEARSPEAVRQARHRERERKAYTFWRFRIRNGLVLRSLIAKVSAEVLEQQRVLVIEELPEYVAAYPERVTF